MNRPQPKSATDLHRNRTGQPGVIDLRSSPTNKHHAEPAKVEHTAHHTPAAPSHAAHDRHEADYQDRLQAARKISRSPLVNKFGGDIRVKHPEGSVHNATANEMATPAASATVAAAAPTRAVTTAARAAAPPPAMPLPPAIPAATAHAEALSTLPPQAATQHEAMAQLVPASAATQNNLPAPSAKRGWRPHLGLAPNRSRILTATAAIVIMGGYIWLQNYPKLALQNASNQAGISASLPGYLPSSYNLAATKTSPGLVTLNFTSPSISEVLKIAQHRTSWDSNSLLDNFVAKQTDAYSTVHGQGLTIYLFGQNQATWVNHGVWYNIDGASKLSREQILKIAYSL